MAENKLYVTQNQENGSVLISEDVIITIVTHAIEEVEGVVGLTATGQHSQHHHGCQQNSDILFHA